MPDRALGKDCNVSGAAANINQADAQLLLIVREHRIARCKLLQSQITDLQSTVTHALVNILRSTDRPGDDMHPRLEAYTRHANRLMDSLLLIDDEFLRQYMQNFAVGRNRYSLRRIDHPVDITLRHLAILDCHDPVRIQAVDVAACNPGKHRMNLASGHQLRLFDRTLY